MRTFLSLSIVLGVVAIGCGGGTRSSDDVGSTQDAFSPQNDASTPGNDAFAADATTPMDDAAGDAAASGACTDTADSTIAGGATFSMDLQNCAQMSFGSEPQLMNCITALGLSAPCATCFDQDVHCTIMHCIGQCAGGNSPQCTMCRMTNCDAAFTACSGRSP
jgi:hypothetical protein